MENYVLAQRFLKIVNDYDIKLSKGAKESKRKFARRHNPEHKSGKHTSTTTPVQKPPAKSTTVTKATAVSSSTTKVEVARWSGVRGGR